MVTQPPTDTPFGLDANVASGLAYLLGPIGGIIMLVGGGTNKVVKWAAAQSITIWCAYVVFWVLATILSFVLSFLALLIFPLMMIVGLIFLALWIWTSISGFQGKDLRVPVFAGIAQSLFAQVLN